MSPPAEQPSNLLPLHPAPAPTTAYALPATTPPQTPSSLTSLETQRLNTQFLLQHQSAYERHRHEGHQDDRRNIAFALQSTGTGQATMAKFCSCGSNATVWRHRQLKYEVRIRCHKCGHRLCPACAAETGWVIQKNLTELGQKTGKNLSLITLTLRHTKAGLASYLARLVTGFRELRRTVVWRKSVTGGAWIIEVKRGQDGDWHAHIHILASALYIRPGELQAAWLTCTGDSSIVDIRRREPFAGARYVAKYLTKPVAASILRSFDDLTEFIVATKRLRRCATFGTWRGTKLTDLYIEELWREADNPDDPENWEQVCHLSDLVDLVSKGDSEAIEIFNHLKLRPKGPAP